MLFKPKIRNEKKDQGYVCEFLLPVDVYLEGVAFQDGDRELELSSHQTPLIRNEREQQSFAEKIKRITEQKKPSYSFEISPAKSEKDFQHLVKSAADAVGGELAAFASVTWHLSPSITERPPSDWSSVPAVHTALGLSELVGQHGVLLHLSAAGLRERDVADVLAAACGEGGVRALFLVRGDNETSRSDFVHAIDLVRFVRSRTEGEQFAIGVAGYPLGHPESRSREEDLLHLREKVKAGADFIISQVVFDATTFLRFVEDCRHIGITVPILAGVPIVTDAGILGRLCKLCRVPVPEAMPAELSRGGRDAGVRWCVRMCRQLLVAGVDGIHFFTLNSIENLKEVVEQLAGSGHSAEAEAETGK
ncbi:methylenetetrahydrofolate reductase [Schistocerca serialis cubense]|uniref:methylenetetrahydrofolate reductase n=1 Tax=Schistocerca serialis cubense TaxID=2023355 RepID=UPI00214EA2EF|nr:methylenetetrahydrofolate reductase [Schistocerca serialis cubense]